MFQLLGNQKLTLFLFRTKQALFVSPGLTVFLDDFVDHKLLSSSRKLQRPGKKVHQGANYLISSR